MSKSCKGLAMELVKCLSETDCVKVSRLPFPSVSLLRFSPRLAAPPLVSIRVCLFRCLDANPERSTCIV